jgi:hypothetical protein
VAAKAKKSGGRSELEHASPIPNQGGLSGHASPIPSQREGNSDSSSLPPSKRRRSVADGPPLRVYHLSFVRDIRDKDMKSDINIRI